MTSKNRLLIVEDEPAIRTGLVDVFVYHGFVVESSDDGTEGLAKALTGRFALVLLDVMLPGIDGYTICNRIRERDRRQPIIMLTAKNTDEDIIRGLSLGADDYIGKPFSVTQLVLRVQAVLRRSHVDTDCEVLKLGKDLTIDVANLRGQRNAEVLEFTRREISLLQYLHANASRPVSREELLAKVWGYGNHQDIETRTVDIHVAKLRRKIEADPALPRFLLTIRGAGYKLMSS